MKMENQAALAYTATRRTYLSIDMNHGRKQEGEGLTRPGRRYSYSILSLEGHGPSLGLNRCRSRETALDDLCQNVLGHGSLFKSHDRFRDIIALDDNLLGSSPSIGFLITFFGDIRMLQVEILFKRDELLLGKVNIVESRTKISTLLSSLTKATTTSVATASAAMSTAAATVASTTSVATAATSVD
jgi:hypothetical protein